MDHSSMWRGLHGALDPLVPAGDPARPELRRVERHYSPAAELTRLLALPFGLHKALLAGASGSGKTTELLGVAATAQDHLVLIVDLKSHFHDQRGDVAALDRLQPWEVLAVIGLAVLRFGEEHLGHRWTASERDGLRAALAEPAGQKSAELDLSGLVNEVAILAGGAALGAGAAGAAVAAGLKLISAVAGNVSASLPLGLPGQRALTDQHQEVQGLLHAVNRLLGRLFEDYGRRVLLIVDGIDRAKTDLARRLFEDSQLLADLVCHQVLAVPLGIRQRNLRGGYNPHFLLNVPVIDPAAPRDLERLGGGIAFFEALWAARAGAVGVSPDVVPSAHIRRLGRASGGEVRRFLEMLQHVVERAYQDDAPGSTDEILAAVIDTWRRRWESGLTSDDIAALTRIAASKMISSADVDQRLLDERCVVAFPNESVWYFPHPLLTLRLV